MKVSFRSLDSAMQEQKHPAGCVVLWMLRHYRNERGKAGKKLLQVLIFALPVTTYCTFPSVKQKKPHPPFPPRVSMKMHSFMSE